MFNTERRTASLNRYVLIALLSSAILIVLIVYGWSRYDHEISRQEQQVNGVPHRR